MLRTHTQGRTAVLAKSNSHAFDSVAPRTSFQCSTAVADSNEKRGERVEMATMCAKLGPDCELVS